MWKSAAHGSILNVKYAVFPHIHPQHANGPRLAFEN